MSENFNLGRERLITSLSLGSPFAIALETGEGDDERIVEFAGRVKARMLANPETKILGFRASEGSRFSDFQASLNQQLGLPPRSSTGAMRDKIKGRKDFLLVVLGQENLSSRDRKRLEGAIKKLDVESILE